MEIFSQETGIPVAVQVCNSDTEMKRLFAKSPGVYDVLLPGESLVAEWIHNKKLAPLNYGVIPNMRHLDSCFVDMLFDPSNRYSVPYLAGVVGIVYNSEQVESEIRSYNDLFDRKYTGRIVVPQDAREIVACALAQLNIRFADFTSANLEEVRKQLARWLPLVSKYSSRLPPQTALRRGEAVAGIVWSGDAVILMRENPKFKWVIPSTGGHLFVDSLVIPASSPHQDQAEQFINFLLRPDISAKISQQYPYFNPNLAARKLLPNESQRCLCLLSQDSLKRKLQLLPPMDSEMTRSLEEIVNSLRPN